MELHQIEYFLAVEKYRNFSTASLEISVSQSTLSQQIKKLEEELGVKLFTRYNRSVRLTPVGEDFLIHARRIMTEIQHTMETIRKYTNYDKGYIRIGAFPNIAHLDLNKIIIHFLNKYPGIEFDLHEANTDELIKLLREKKVHAAFINSPFPEDAEFDYYPLVDDRVAVLMSSRHPLASQPVIDLKELAEEKFLMLKTSSFYRQYIVNACNDSGFEPKIILDCNDVEMVRSFVEGGLGVSLLGHHLASRITNGHTVIVPLKQKLIRQVGLAVPKYTRPPLATSLFREFTLKEFAKFAAPGSMRG